MARGDNKRTKRPEWWTLDYVLEQISSGVRLQALTRNAVARSGDKLKKSTLDNEVRRWRFAYPDKFKVAFEAAFRVDQRYQAGQPDNGDKFQSQKGRTHVFDDERQALFLAELEQHGQVIKAAGAAGIHPTTIYSKINRTSHLFDQVFFDRFIAAEGNRLAAIREKFYEEAETGGFEGRGNAWVQDRILQSRLPELHNPKHMMEISGTVKHDLTLSGVALEAIASQTATLLASRRPALPEAPVLEAELVEVGKPS
jgi:hypothetical protein